MAKLLQKNTKPFSNGDLIKDCLMTVVDIVCPEKKKLFFSVSLFCENCHPKNKEMSQDVKPRRQDCLKFRNTFQ